MRGPLPASGVSQQEAAQGTALPGSPPTIFQLTTAQRVARNTVSLVSVQGFRTISALVVTLYVARFGAVWLGKYALLLAYLNIFQVLADFGLPRLATREVASDFSRSSSYFWNALAAQLATSLASVALMMVAVTVIGYPADTTHMLSVATLAIPPYALASVAGALLQARERMTTLAVSEGINTVWQLVGSIWLLATGHGVVALAWVRVIGVAITALVNTVGMQRVSPVGRPVVSARSAGQLLKRSFDLFVLAGFGAILFRLDVLILTEIAGEAATGRYNAAYQLAKVVTLLSMAYADAIFPALSRFYSPREEVDGGSDSKAGWVLRKSMAWGATFLLPAAIAGMLLAEPIISLLYRGGEYTTAVPVLSWLGWMLLPFFIYITLTRALVAANQQRIARDTTVLMVVVGALLQVVLAIQYGVVGTAAATTLTFALGAARNAYFTVRCLCPLNLAGAVVRALPGTIGITIALALTAQWSLWTRLPLAAGVFAVVAWGAGALTREDLRMIRKMLGRREAAAISS